MEKLFVISSAGTTENAADKACNRCDYKREKQQKCTGDDCTNYAGGNKGYCQQNY